jgi:hypothetical protein
MVLREFSHLNALCVFIAVLNWNLPVSKELIGRSQNGQCVQELTFTVSGATQFSSLIAPDRRTLFNRSDSCANV